MLYTSGNNNYNDISNKQGVWSCTHAEMSLACLALPTLKWWPSLPPLLSATVPLEVRLADSSPLFPWSHVPPVTRLSVVRTVLSPHLYSPWTRSHSFCPACAPPPCGTAFTVRFCFIEDESGRSLMPVRNRNLNVSVSFVMLQEHWSTVKSMSLGHLCVCSTCAANYTDNCGSDKDCVVVIETSWHVAITGIDIFRRLWAWPHQDKAPWIRWGVLFSCPPPPRCMMHHSVCS